MSGQASESAYPLTPHALGVPSPPRLGRPRTRTRGFSGSSPSQEGRGPGGPRRGGSATALTETPTGEDASGAVGGPGSPLTGSHGPGRGETPLPPGATSCGPARPRWRRPDAGAGGSGDPEGRAPVGGATFASPGSPARGAGGGRKAWPGPEPLISTSPSSTSGPDRPRVGDGLSTPPARRVYWLFAEPTCCLSSFSIFRPLWALGPQEWKGSSV